MDSSSKGDLAEIMVIERLLREGAQVAIPYGNQKGWDLLVLQDGKWERWQIKNVYWNMNNGIKRKPQRMLITSQHQNFAGRRNKKRPNLPYSQDDCDTIVGVDTQSREMWKIGVAELSGRKSLSLKSEHSW